MMQSFEAICMAKETGERLASKGKVALQPGSGPAVGPCIRIDPSQTFQTIVSFGGAFTEAAVTALHRLPAEKQS